MISNSVSGTLNTPGDAFAAVAAKAPSVCLLVCLLALGSAVPAAEPVTLIRVPEAGIQPQAAIDAEGLVHLLFFKGESSAGDLFYARLDGGGKGFEPERNVITQARGLDGGGSIAADGKGNVYVTWHPPKPGNTNGEAGRAVFVAHSADDGVTFAPERLATREPTGACGCCGMKAFADRWGNLFASYRSASEKLNRDQTLLVASGGSLDFRIALSHPWQIASCPMSSTSFSETPTQVLASWETAGNVHFARIDPRSLKVSPLVSPPGGTTRKHPVAVGNARGEVLLAWTEGTGWARGGDVVWQVFDRSGNSVVGQQGRVVAGLPTWSLVSAVATADDRFLIVY